jgi:glycosyltransferase involved in cell wall biosynthesis
MADRRLHVVVDGRELLGKPTGVGRFLTEVLRAWAEDESFRHRVTIVVPRDPPPAPFPQDARFAWYIEPGRTAGTRWEQTRLPRRVRALGADVLLAPAYTAPLRVGVPVVLVVHDVSFFAHPEWFPARERWRRRWLTRASARRAAAVVTVSQFSAGEVVRWMGIPRDRVIVAPNGAPRASGPGAAPGGREPMVLYVGSLFTRRRLPDLIGAFALVAAADRDARLVLVGDNRTSPRIDPRAMAAGLGVADRVDWREYVDDAELDRLYDRARAFVFLSDYEGFAMTPLEAIAHGVPPVLLDTPVAREIYDDAALYVRPDPPAVADAILTLLGDAAVRARLAAAGARALARYSWVRTAALIRETIEAAAR